MNLNKNFYLCIIALIIIILIAWCTPILCEDFFPTEPEVRVYVNLESDENPGGIVFETRRFWNKKTIFLDSGFDGTLNEIRIPYEDKIIDPNELWIERYYQVRQWATTGEKPNI